MPTPTQLDKYFDTAVPASLGFSWDSGGISLLVNDCESNRIVVALDATSAAIDFASSIGAGILVTHHPAIFGKIEAIRADDAVGKRLINAVRSGVSLLGYHTRLDNAPGGVNDTLCSLVGIEDTTEFIPCARLGKISSPVTPEAFGDLVGEALNSDRITVFANAPFVCRVAVCSGSGGNIVRDAYLAGADTVLTGEAKYNYELDAAEYGINLITAGHKETEQIVLPVLKDIILKGFPSAEVFVYYA